MNSQKPKHPKRLTIYIDGGSMTIHKHLRRHPGRKKIKTQATRIKFNGAVVVEGETEPIHGFSSKITSQDNAEFYSLLMAIKAATERKTKFLKIITDYQTLCDNKFNNAPKDKTSKQFWQEAKTLKTQNQMNCTFSWVKSSDNVADKASKTEFYWTKDFLNKSSSEVLLKEVSLSPYANKQDLLEQEKGQTNEELTCYLYGIAKAITCYRWLLKKTDLEPIHVRVISSELADCEKNFRWAKELLTKSNKTPKLRKTYKNLNTQLFSSTESN